MTFTTDTTLHCPVGCPRSDCSCTALSQSRLSLLQVFDQALAGGGARAINFQQLAEDLAECGSQLLMYQVQPFDCCCGLYAVYFCMAWLQQASACQPLHAPAIASGSP